MSLKNAKLLTPSERIERAMKCHEDDTIYTRYARLSCEARLQAYKLEHLEQNGVKDFNCDYKIKAEQLAAELERAKSDLSRLDFNAVHIRQERDEFKAAYSNELVKTTNLRRQLGEIEHQRSQWKADNANLRRQVEELKELCKANPMQLIEQARQLRAENAELRKDKERLDWLEHHLPNGIVDTDTLIPPKWFITSSTRELLSSRCDTLRQAIDAAKLKS